MKKAANIFFVLFMILALSLLSTPGVELAAGLCNNASLTPLLVSTPEVKAAAATTLPDLSVTARCVRRTAGEPGFSECLDWPILALAGAGESVESLIHTREGQVRQGQLFDSQRSTDFHRTIIGAVAAGKDPQNFGGYNLIAKIKESQLQNGKFGDTISGKGERLVNAHIWGILSLYAAGEPIPNGGKALSWLINKQNADGGFSVDTFINNSDVDMTGMALMAFAALGCDSGHPAVRKALGYLQSQQQENGDFSAWNSNGPESIAQVIHGLVMLGIDPVGPEWTRKEGSLLSALLRYRRADGSFGRSPDGADFISTYQALAALGDLERGESIYTILYRKNAGFSDLLPGDSAFEDVKELVSREVLSGYPDGTFRPDNPVRRDEFAKMITAAMGKKPRSQSKSSGFDDVPPSHWACPYIRLAVESGLITGKAPHTFAPGDNISGAEVMTILIHALGEGSRAQARSGEPWYGGFVRVAREKELLYSGFDAAQPAARAQCAYCLMRLLEQI